MSKSRKSSEAEEALQQQGFFFYTENEPQSETVYASEDDDANPVRRIRQEGAAYLTNAELLAVVMGGTSYLEAAHRIMECAEYPGGMYRLGRFDMRQIRGIGEATVDKLQALAEFGRRMGRPRPEDAPRVSSPSDAANLVMWDMVYLEQEHLRIIMLDTRNRVIGMPTVYIGSLNTSVVRLAEVFKPAIKANAAAIIVVHNHPSGDPSPSPEDVRVTRELVSAGKLLDISVLDHLIVGNNRYTSLKERNLGFETFPN